MIKKGRLLNYAFFSDLTVQTFDGEKLYISTGNSDDFLNGEKVTYDKKPSRANLQADEGTVLFAKMKGTRKTLLIDEKMKESGIAWIGEIPDEWGIGKVKFAFIRKNAKAEQEAPTVLKLARSGIQIRSIDNNEGQLAESYFNYNPVDIGDLLLNPMDLQSGANCNTSYVKGVISPAYINLRAKKGFIARYYDYYFKTQYWSYAFFAHGKGVSFDNRWTLNSETIQNYYIPIPSLNEQQFIANYLDEKVGQIDKLIKEQNNAIENWKAYKQSLISGTVTKGLNPNAEMKESGIKWIGEVPKEWDCRKLKTIISQKVTDGPHETPEFINEGIPFLSVDAIIDGKLSFKNCRYISEKDAVEYLKKCRPQEGDILMGKSASTGKICTVETDEIFSVWSPLALIRVDRQLANNKFIEYHLKSSISQYEIDIKCNNSTQKNIGMESISNLSLIIPPLQTQQEIANHLNERCSKIDDIIKQKQILIEQLDEYKRSLIYECVTGKRKVF